MRHQTLTSVMSLPGERRQQPAGHANAVAAAELHPPLHLLQREDGHRQHRAHAVAHDEPVQRQPVLDAAEDVDEHLSAQQRQEPADGHLSRPPLEGKGHHGSDVVGPPHPCPLLDDHHGHHQHAAAPRQQHHAPHQHQQQPAQQQPVLHAGRSHQPSLRQHRVAVAAAVAAAAGCCC
ncbi:hypothetical protein COO60DRAFT_1499939 [Scenedesmus sp. NREL 46B-D3]|nr:hypothetical protein COO60DRAFT_1499939 [Scenedesmus sp. NREL 46B-D3]